jgi:hypothetical protein
MRQNDDFHHQSHLHVSSEDSRAADAQLFLFFFLICTKLKMPLGLNNNDKKTIRKLQPTPLIKGYKIGIARVNE